MRAKALAHVPRIGFVTYRLVGYCIGEQDMPERFPEMLVADGRLGIEQELVDRASNPPPGAPDERLAQGDFILTEISREERHRSPEIPRVENRFSRISPRREVDVPIHGHFQSRGRLADSVDDAE